MFEEHTEIQFKSKSEIEALNELENYVKNQNFFEKAMDFFPVL